MWRLLTVLTLALAGCAGTGPGPAATTATPPAIRAPLGTTFATTSGVVAVVAMGTLSDPLNTFWQIFVRPEATSRWTLVTPPGVADNGGLVASPSPRAGGTVIAGFEPNQDLAFSPLALSRDDGGSWSTGLVPAGLAAVPDALAASPGPGFLALLRSAGGEVVRSTGNPSVWSEVVTRHVLASSPAGMSCGVRELTAVAFDATGTALVGTSCTSSTVGLFARAGTGWRRAGPRLPGRAGSEPTKVVRLVDADGMADALVAVGGGRSTSLIAMAGTDGGSWTLSAPLALGSGTRIVSTGVEAGGGFVVLASRRGRSTVLDAETGPGGAWRSLPLPPPGTATVAVASGGVVAALVVASTRLTDWRLDATTGTWIKVGTLTVPIQFGSSS